MKVRKEFGPLDSLDARTLLQELVSLGLGETAGAGRWTEYRMKEQWGPQTDESGQLAIDFEASDAFHPEPPAAHSTPVDPTDLNSSDAERRAAATSKHGKILWNALQEGPKNARELSEATELGIAQVRYGMKRLVGAGLIHRSGGQGYRQTTYSIL